MPPLFSREIEQPVVSTGMLKYQTRTSPCEAACPAGNPIQKVQGLVKESQYERALEFLRARNPFPGTTGRICTHPCETECNRRTYDEAISIRGLERSVADYADMTRVRKPLRMDRSGKKIGVIGGGPAGLTFAYFSSLLGHEVTIFEAGPILGGMPRLNVPEYRLPKDILDLEIGLILETGVKARTNTRVGRDLSFDEIRASFDAVCIACGTWKEREPGVANGGNALKGVEFLRQVNLGILRKVGRQVVIIGGGGVAFDCAFTARRLGAEEVHVVCLEEADKMCAPSDDLIQARQEGITVHNGCTASEVLTGDGKAIGITCFGVEVFSFDDAGEAHITAAAGAPWTMNAETVIIAAGVQPQLDFLEGTGIEVLPNGTIKTDPFTMTTSLKGVFAAGDAATGPSIVARAVGQGREAALAAHRYLTARPKEHEACTIAADGGITFEAILREGTPHVATFEEIWNIEYYEKAPRETGGTLDMPSLQERDQGLDRVKASLEAARCFHCGHCHKCGKCVEDCPGLILEMKDKGPEVVYPEECWHCGNCRISCPDSAVSYEFPLYTLV
jgi:formate dehydrogenase (NADP+) beta subunit